MDPPPCLPGTRWDLLVKECVSSEALVKPQQPVPGECSADSAGPLGSITNADTLAALSTRAPAQLWTEVAPSVWICVGVILSSSVLALLLWFIIYRRHTRNSGKRSSEPSASPQCNGNTPGPAPPEQKDDALLLCPHWNGRAQEVCVCEMGLGPGLCKGKVQHGVPVPATELGDSALVTTKTVQPEEA